MLVALLIAALLPQQTEQLSRIEGVVLDAMTNQPVARARVIAARSSKGISASVLDVQPAAGEQDPAADQVAVLTDEEGRFRFGFKEPGEFALYADAEGYVRPTASIGPENTHHPTPDAPKTGIVFRLIRAVNISGRVIDADTEQPLRGLEVMPLMYRNIGPRRDLTWASRAVKTGDDGRFTIERVGPGDYYFEIRQPLDTTIGEPKPVEDFLHAADLNYTRTWYPGVARKEEALPVKVIAGAGVEGVEIEIAKRRTASIRGRIFGDEQAIANGDVSLMLGRMERDIFSISYSVIARGKSKVGSGFQIDRLSPGTYWLSASSRGRTPAEWRAARIALTVGEENQEGFDLHLTAGATIKGRVRMEGREEKPDEPALPADTDIRVGLAPMTRAGSVDPGERPAPARAADGAFLIEGVTPERYQVTASSPKGYKISEVRYNGALCSHNIIDMDAAAHEHKLDVTLAPAAGSINVTVNDGADPASGAAVLFIREPVTDDALHVSLRPSKADKDGRATIANLVAGTYRVIAYPAGAYWGEDPNLKQRLAGGQEARVTGKQPAVIHMRTQPAP